MRNSQQIGSTTHTRQKLNSVSFPQVLVAARDGAGWDAGAPTVRGHSRADLGSAGNRDHCTLGVRLRQPDSIARSARSNGAIKRGRGMAVPRRY